MAAGKKTIIYRVYKSRVRHISIIASLVERHNDCSRMMGFLKLSVNLLCVNIMSKTFLYPVRTHVKIFIPIPKRKRFLYPYCIRIPVFYE